MTVSDAAQTELSPPGDAEIAEASPRLRFLPKVAPRESRFADALWQLIAIAITAGYAYFLASFSAPGMTRPGIDENCYLIAGRNIAEHGTPGFKPTDEFQFISAMWIRTPEGWY